MSDSQCHPAGRVIAMAASVGGLQALSVILGGLPADFPAAIAIVMHLAPDHQSILAEILNRRTDLLVRQAKSGDILCHACAFVAPPNHHLSVAQGGRLKLSSSRAEKVHFARPSAEPLFASVARVYQQNAIAVVLTGGDGDGSFGVQIIKDQGGLVIAQDRPTSENFSMPETSIKTGDVDFILPLDEIAPKLIALVWAGNKLNGRPSAAPAPAKTIQSVIRGRMASDPAEQSERGVHAASTSEPKRVPVSDPARPAPRMVKRRKRRAPAAAQGNRPTLAVAKGATPRYAAGGKAVMLKPSPKSA